MSLYHDWLDAKEAEREAIAKRREIEDELIQIFSVDDLPEGSKTRKDSGYVVKITTRMNRKVDSDMLQDLAADAGLTDHLTSLFRWKPELNIKAWKAADPSITGQLARAIEAKPGRPSFAITLEEN